MSLVSISTPTYTYIFCDPASGKKSVHKRVKSRAAMVCCAADFIGRVYVLECWTGRGGTDQLVSAFIDMCEKWKPRIAAYESAGQQDLLMDPILAEGRRRHVEVPLLAVKQPQGLDKRARIRLILQPVVAEGRLIIGEKMTELESELKSFPTGQSSDIIDALSSCIRLMPPPLPVENVQEEREALAEYLRETGAAPHIIERECGSTKKRWWDEVLKEVRTGMWN